MSDAYSFGDAGNVVAMEASRRRQIAAEVMQSYDLNPDDAARAKDLSQLTGDPASVIGQDVGSYESEVQRVTGSRIVTSSDILRDFVQRDPMHAAIAQDDWDNLTEYEQALKNIGAERPAGVDPTGKPIPSLLGGGPITAAGRAGAAFYRGWMKGAETAHGPETLEAMEEAFGKTELRAYEAGKPYGLGLLAAAPFTAERMVVSGGNAAFKLLMGLTTGAQEGLQQWLLESGADPYTAKRLGRAAGEFVEWRLVDLAHGHKPSLTQFEPRPEGGRWLNPVDPRMIEAQRFEQLPLQVQKMMAPVIESQNLAKPFIEAGEAIPPGLHPLLDELLKEQDKYEARMLAEAQRAADKTNIKERSPATLEDFTRGALGDRYVYVDIDALHGLYAGKTPEPNDGLLGWVPDIQRAMQDGLLTGDRLAIPMDQWLSRTDPEVRKALKDDIAIRLDGNTKNDWDAIPPPQPKAMAEKWNVNNDATRTWEAVESVRKASKLEPLEQRPEAPQRLLIKKAANPAFPGELGGEHSFMVTDEIGRHVADLEIDLTEGGKNLDVVWFGGRYIPHQIHTPVTNLFGPTLIRDLFRQLREQFPQAETISGRRISGARAGTQAEGGTVKINIDALRMEVEDPAVLGPETSKFLDVGESGEWRNVTNRLQYRELMRDDLPVDQQQIVQDTQAIVNRIYPPEIRGRMAATKQILLDGRPVYGVWHPFDFAMPLIYWSLEGMERGTVRHEVIHHLRAYGYISRDEWQTLRAAATRENWIKKHDIADRYKGDSLAEQLEEAIAEEFRTWAKDKPSTAYSGTFGKLLRLLEEIRDYFKEMFGRDVTPQDIFQKIERGTVARRGMGEVLPQYFDPRTTGMMAGPGVPRAMAPPRGPRQPMLPDILPQSERPTHEPGALMPVQRQRLYEREIEKQRTKDKEFQERQAEKQVKKEASDKWLDEVASRLPRIEEEVRNSPGFAIDAFFREGTISGVKLDQLPKINREMVPPEYAAEIPKNWLSKKGESPDTLASLFGLGDGTEFLNMIAEFQLARGELGPKKFFEKTVGLRVQREMEREFGTKGDMIKKAAEDHVYNDGQLELLHQDTLAMAAQLNQQISFTREDVVRQMEQRLNTLKMKDANFKNSTRALYQAGGKLEDSLLRNDTMEAFRQAQRKENAFALAVGIKKLEKDQAAHARLLKAYRKRIPDGRDQEFTPFVHDVLERMGESARPRSDINTEMAATQWGTLAKLDEWLQTEHELKIVPDFLLDPNWKGDPKLMTVEEWRGVNDFLTTMDKLSRDQNSFITANLKYDLRHMIDDLMVPAIEKGYPKLKATGEYALTAPEPGIVKKSARAFYAQSLHMETVFNWFDRNHPKGIFNQALVREYTTAANRADALDKEFGNLIAELKAIKNPHRLVSQKLFLNPDTGEPLQMTRMHILGILANMGNPSNFYTMIDGYKIPREMAQEVANLVWKHVTREDVVRMTEMAKIMKSAKEMSDRMYRQMTGVAPMKIDVWSVQTPFKDLGQNGLIEGWYYPLIYDPRFKQTSEKLAAPSPLEFPYWTKSNLPAAGYTKERTGYKGPILLELDGFRNRLHMIIRDVAWRPTLANMSKVFKDPEFKRAIKDHWGPHYEALLDPFLKDIAGHRDVMDANSAWGTQMVQFIRQNVISHMVGLNPATIAKHSVTAAIQSITEVGVKDFGRALFSLLGRNPETGERNWTFAMNKSEELQRRHRNALDGITSNFDRTFGQLKTAGLMRDYLDTMSKEGLSTTARLAITDFKGKYLRLRDWMHYYEASPMAFFDLLSAVPTWLARYRQAKMAGENEGNAIFMSDRAVRYAHGSSAITTRPQMMRHNVMASLFGNFYTFFSHILQRQIMTAWSARAGLRGEGVYVRQPTGELEPAKQGRHVEGETEGEYQKTEDYKNGLSLAAPLTGMFIAYFLFPAWWDEVVSPMRGEKGVGPDKNESTLGYMAKVELKGLGGSWLIARDVVHGFMEGGDVSAGLWGEVGKYMTAVRRSTTQAATRRMTTQEKQNFIKRYNGLLNSATGVFLPNSLPRAGAFGTNWYYHTEHPQNFREFWTGITKGTAHPRHH